MQLNNEQIQFLKGNLEGINRLIKQNQQQLKTQQYDMAKKILSQQIKCLKQNAQHIEQMIKNKTIIKEV